MNITVQKDSLVVFDEKTGSVSLNYTGEDPLIIRAKILQLKDDLLKMAPEDRTEMQCEHVFAGGMYLRKLYIPKGTILVGKIHKQECMNIVAKGDISVLTETGSARLTAGYTVVSPAGIQKVGFAHEDTIFINVFLTNETDVEKLEETLSCENYEAMNIQIELKPEVLCL